MTPNAHHQVAVAGASGRMGHMLIEAIVASGDCELAGALDIASSPAIGQLASGFMGATSGPVITADLAAGLANAQVLIDFTRPEGTLAHLQVCRALGVNLVIGTTGFTEAQKAEIADAAREIAIVMAPNMSVGVNVTLKLLEMAGNRWRTQIVTDLRKVMKLNRHHSLFKQGRLADSLAEHRALMLALEQRNAVRATQLMKAHFDNGLEAAA